MKAIVGEDLNNPTKQTFTLTGIQMSGLKHARILAVGANDVTHRAGISGTSWPTSDKTFADPWIERKKLKGFRVLPGHDFQILILARRTKPGTEGSLSGARLYYTGPDSARYFSDDHEHFIMAAGRCR
jgi:hypothetical protein